MKFSTNLRNSSDLIVWTYRNTRQILIVLVSVTTCCWFTLDHGHLPLNERPPRQVRICQSFLDRPPVGWTHGAEAIKNPKPRYTTESNLFEPLQAGLKSNKFNIPVQYCKAGKVSPSVFAWKGRASNKTCRWVFVFPAHFPGLSQLMLVWGLFVFRIHSHICHS